MLTRYGPGLYLTSTITSPSRNTKGACGYGSISVSKYAVILVCKTGVWDVASGSMGYLHAAAVGPPVLAATRVRVLEFHMIDIPTYEGFGPGCQRAGSILSWTSETLSKFQIGRAVLFAYLLHHRSPASSSAICLSMHHRSPAFPRIARTGAWLSSTTSASTAACLPARNTPHREEPW